MKPRSIPYWIGAFFIMGAIFFFSSQNGESSSSLSAHFIQYLLPFLPVDKAQFIVRKAAHFSIYFLLGFFYERAFHTSGLDRKKSMSYALIACFLYACFDEWHQTWVDERSGQMMDVLIDSFGGFCAILLTSRMK